ncbi:MAG: EF-hand domain-containing protein [Myxococcota bacterium]
MAPTADQPKTEHSLTEDQIAELREIFGHYDDNGNGVIDRDEFRALLEALDAQLTDDEIDAGLRAVDSNGNGQIEFEEFLEWWAHH